MSDQDTSTQLIDRRQLRLLSERSDRAGLRQLALHLALLIATGLLIWQTAGSWWQVPAMLLHGIVLIFLFMPLHECIHRTAFASRNWNDRVAFAIGCLLILPRDYFRFFHFAHHRFTQDPVRDPELASPKPINLQQWLWHVSGLPYWIGQSRALIAHARGKVDGDFYNNARQRQEVMREARLILMIYAGVALLSVLTRSPFAFTYWLIPAILGQPFLRLYLLAEHTLCPLTDDMLANTRTTYTNGLVRFLAWNMPYHTEHHAYPSVPFHALPKAHQLIRAQLQVTAPGYLDVQRQILRSFSAG